MSHNEVSAAFPVRAQLGEGSFWSARYNALYWVDIPEGKLHRSDPETRQTQTWELGKPVGCVAETEDGRIVAALTVGFTLLDPRTGVMTPLGGPKPGDSNHRFNDGTVDPAGRFLAGTMGLDAETAEKAQGTLYAFDGKHAREVMTGFKTINGLTFSPDGKTAYVSDSNRAIQTIWAYDYHVDDGAWTNKRPFFDCSSISARPDGGAMDSDGCYWMAGVSGWQLVRITPTGKIDMTIDVPVEKPTRIAFGGPKRDVIYTTSIATPGDPKQPLAGMVLTVHVPGVKGMDLPTMRLVQ